MYRVTYFGKSQEAKIRLFKEEEIEGLSFFLGNLLLNKFEFRVVHIQGEAEGALALEGGLLPHWHDAKE